MRFMPHLCHVPSRHSGGARPAGSAGFPQVRNLFGDARHRSQGDDLLKFSRPVAATALFPPVATNTLHGVIVSESTAKHAINDRVLPNEARRGARSIALLAVPSTI